MEDLLDQIDLLYKRQDKINQIINQLQNKLERIKNYGNIKTINYLVQEQNKGKFYLEYLIYQDLKRIDFPVVEIN